MQHPATKPVAVYVRVSSRSQDTRGQEAELERWVKAGMTPAVWYRDKFTGRTMDRPGWNKLQADLEAGRIGAVVVWRLDRLGRSVRGLVTLIEELRRRKVGLISLRDGFDLETPSGRLLAHILASIAEFENEVRSERQRAGIDAARLAGKRWGGSRRGRRLKVTSEAAETVMRLRGEGWTISAIARATNLSRPTIYSILGSPAE